MIVFVEYMVGYGAVVVVIVGITFISVVDWFVTSCRNCYYCFDIFILVDVSCVNAFFVSIFYVDIELLVFFNLDLLGWDFLCC